MDISAGADIEVTNNTISNNLGVASVDGSTSAGVLVSTFFGPGTDVTLTGNDFDANSTGVFVGFDANDTSTVDIQPGNTIDGGTTGLVVVGNSTVTGTADLAGANATVNWDGGASANSISGGSLNDTLDGGGNDDTIFGGEGDDEFHGNGGSDIAVIADSGGVAAVPGDYDVSGLTATAGVVSGTIVGPDGTETLSGIEIIEIANTGSSTFVVVAGMSIQAAIDAASDGDTIMINAGTYTESLSVDKAITLVGVADGFGNKPVIDSAGNGITITGDIDGGGSETVTIQGLALENNAVGVRVASDAVLSNLVIDDAEFTGNTVHGVGTGSGAPGLGSISILNSSFDDNGFGGSNGSGDIILFGYTGNATIQNVDITSSKVEADPQASKGDNAIQIAGFDPSTYDVTAPLGTVILNNVTVNGAYHKPHLAIQGYTDLSGASFTNVALTGSANWGFLVFVDPIASPGTDTPGASGYPGNFAGGAAASTLDLSGVTVINGSTGATFDVFVRGTDANDVQTGTEADDVLNALAEGDVDYGGNDTINGAGGNDVLFGGDGEDSLSGGAGDDTLDGGADNDTLLVDLDDTVIDGGADFDTAIFAGGTSLTSVFAKEADFTDVELIRVGAPGSASYVVFSGMSFQDAGNAAQSGDTIYYGSSTIDLSFASNPVNIDIASASASGLDIPAVTLSTNTVNGIGGLGDDTLTGDTRANTLSGGGGNDTFVGSAGIDIIDGNGGSNTLSYASFGTAVFADMNGGSAFGSGIGFDTFSNIQVLIGGSGNDVVFANDAGSEVRSGSGADQLSGDIGNDTLHGDNGDDTLNGGDGNDQLFGGLNNDTLNGDADNDTLNGGKGNDDLNGGTGDDSLLGGANEDVLRGGDDNDTLLGGNGFDTLYGDAGNDSLLGELGRDTLYGGANKDTLDGGQGNDLLFGGADEDLLQGDIGNDTLHGDNGDDTLNGGDGNDQLLGGLNNDTLNGDGDNDTLNGGKGNDDLNGGTGDDSLLGGANEDVLRGGDDNDTLLGGNGFDTLYGDAGNDRLDGGQAGDLLTGGADSDVFIFVGAFGDDTITDFDEFDDLEDIDLSGVAAITDYTDLLGNHMNQVGADVVIDDGLGNSITVLNTLISDMNEADFTF